MRLAIVSLLTLIAATASAQTNDLYCFPTYSVPEGGVEVFISSTTSHRFKAPQVFFGGVLSPHITVETPQFIKAVAPAHAQGLVDLTVRDGDVVLHLLDPFAYVPVLEQILIPIAFDAIAANGTRWVSDISIYNDSDDTVPLDPEECIIIGRWVDCRQYARRISPRSSMRIEPFPWADEPAMILHPPADQADRLHFSVRLRETTRDPDSPGTEIPVVRSRDFTKLQVWLPSVPVSVRFRSTLRVFTRAALVTVRVKDNATGELLREWSGSKGSPTDSDPFGTLTFPGLLEAAEVRSHEKVRIEVESSLPVWALLTLTDNESQRVQIFTPQ